MAEVELEVEFDADVIEEVDAIAIRHGVAREDVIAVAIADFVYSERRNLLPRTL
jgi:metal-responsive CopG/Arc/MetJ family transcriptional regulator